MRIERLEFLGVVQPLLDGDVFWYAQGSYRRRFASMIRIEGGGLVGWGEAFIPPEHAAGWFAQIAESLVGVEVSRAPRAVASLRQSMIDFGRHGAHMRLLGGISLALDDLVGKKHGATVAGLNGGPVVERIQGYATALYWKSPPEEFDIKRHRIQAEEEVGNLVSSGYRLVKIKVGISPEVDRSIISDICDAYGDRAQIAVDFNCAYQASEVLSVLAHRDLRHCNIAWIEEPLHPSDLAGYRYVRRNSPFKIAMGESLNTPYEFAEVIHADCCDILQPNASVVGGIRHALNIAVLAAVNSNQMIPHSWGSEVALAAGLTVAASAWRGDHARPSIPLIEVDCSPNPLRESFAKLTWTKEGSSFLPNHNAVGLGVEVDEEKVRDLATHVADVSEHTGGRQ